MRDAEIRKHWREVYQGEYPNRLSSISLSAVSPLGSTTVCFSGGITAICGANGVGKSTILFAIRAMLAQEQPDPRDARWPTRHGGAAAGVFSRKSADHALELSEGTIRSHPELDHAVSVSIIDVLDWYYAQADYFGPSTNPDEFLESYEPRIATAADLSVLRYILGKQYDSVEVFEVADFDDADPIPFFRVKCRGASYTSLSMGLGELSVHLLLWQLGRAAPLSVVLLEEPETFVAPFSQEALLNVIARASAEKKLWTIFTTHSPSLLNRVPLEHIRLVTSDGSTATIQTPRKRSDLLDALRVPVPVHGILFVEDAAAKEFLRRTIEHASFEWGREYEICEAGGADGVLRILQTISPRSEGLRFVGVLDGDQRERHFEAKWPCLFLPGNSAPESMLRDCVESNPDLLATTLGRLASDVRVALSGASHLDEHDWMHELSRMLGLSVAQLHFALFSVWSSFEPNSTLCHELVSSLRLAVTANVPLSNPSSTT